MNYIELSNGVRMPQLGFGVYQTPPPETERVVREAIEVGYRSIDTAQAYGNEEGVGAAVSGSGLPREEFFITTKVWITNAGEKRAAASIDESLKRLRTDYVDLLLVHQPFGDYYGTYRAMEKALEAGKVRAIGVSNFYPDRYLDIEHFARIKPVVNQMETHIFQQQAELRPYLQKHGCRLESWGPFAEGRNNFFTNETLCTIGQAHNKTPAQIALRYLLELGVIVIPKTTHRARMEENLAVFDFALTEGEKTQLAALDTANSLFFSHHDPKTVEWFMTMA